MTFYKKKKNKNKESKVKKLIKMSKSIKKVKSKSSSKTRAFKIKKKSGMAETFSAIKLKNSIKNAAKDAGVAPVKIKVLVDEIADPVIKLIKKEEIKESRMIRNLILKKLDAKAKPVSNSWRKFEKKK